ncbi:hypothetical protein GCM10009827_083810 [Dactylosporangium maewongense]|uniref:HTH cro/C1-type domain-containing protein n=1 Tax=Dactylosporangium maewongense TaxID=634393 RepID=A0ABN2C296_9ACTN
MIRYNSRKPEGAEAARLAEAVGSLLCAARERWGWSRTHLARLAGMSPSSVAAIETGRSRPAWRSLVRLAAALHPDDPVRAAAFAHDLADAAGPSLGSDPSLPPTVVRELFVEVLSRSMVRLGLDLDDDAIRHVVMAEIRGVLGSADGVTDEARLAVGS